MLKKIADSLEPRRDLLKKLNKTAVDDFFFLVNKMNIRHNNCDPSDEAKYCKSFDEMSISEKEDWYDLIYNQALMLYILFDYQSRKEKIRIFKEKIRSLLYSRGSVDVRTDGCDFFLDHFHEL